MSDLLQTSQFDPLIPLIKEMNRKDQTVTFMLPPDFVFSVDGVFNFMTSCQIDNDWRDSGYISPIGVRDKVLINILLSGKIADPGVFNYLYAKVIDALEHRNERPDDINPYLTITFA